MKKEKTVRVENIWSKIKTSMYECPSNASKSNILLVWLQNVEIVALYIFNQRYTLLRLFTKESMQNRRTCIRKMKDLPYYTWQPIVGNTKNKWSCIWNHFEILSHFLFHKELTFTIQLKISLFSQYLIFFLTFLKA